MFLQHLQSRFGRARFVLKAPAHMYQLQALLTEYPDALIVQTHRDLMKVLPSIGSFAAALRNQFCAPSTVDPIDIGRSIIHQLVHGVRHVMSVRERVGKPERFHDLLYADLSRDPMAAIDRLYAHFGLPLTDKAREAMALFIRGEANARHGHGRHKYAMADYGFTETEIDEMLGDYIKQYSVPKEAVASE
jgi:hypothetical protein